MLPALHVGVDGPAEGRPHTPWRSDADGGSEHRYLRPEPLRSRPADIFFYFRRVGGSDVDQLCNGRLGSSGACA